MSDKLLVPDEPRPVAASALFGLIVGLVEVAASFLRDGPAAFAKPS